MHEHTITHPIQQEPQPEDTARVPKAPGEGHPALYAACLLLLEWLMQELREQPPFDDLRMG